MPITRSQSLLPDDTMDVEQLQETIRDLQARLQEAEARAGRDQPPHMAQPVAPPVAPAPSRVKVAVPDEFNGNVDTTDRFVKQLGLYFLARHADFPTDMDRVIFALSYMKGGTASAWADQVTGDILEGRMPFVAYADFIKAVTERFGDPDAGATARRKLELARQSNRSVDEYVSEFQTYAPRTGYDETALVEFFQRGLNQNILAKIYNLPVLPITLLDWIMYASRFDRQRQAFEARRGPSENRHPAAISTGRSAPSASPTTQPRASAAPGATATTATVKQEPRSPRLCWKCNSPDHLACECSAPEAERMRTLIREVLIGMRDDVAAPKEKEKEEEKETKEREGFQE
jgi:Retrotransposon gag protein